MPIIKGDVNFDGVLDATDVTALTAALADVPAWKAAHSLTDAEALFIADLDGDSAITNADIAALTAYINSNPAIQVLAMGGLNNQVGEIIQRLLIAYGLATLPTDQQDWPVYYNHLPDGPDACLTVYDTENIEHGRAHGSGEVLEHYGFQILARSAVQRAARQRLQHIDRVFATAVLRTAITVGSYSYQVQAITRQGGVLFVGLDETSRRRIYTANYLAAITMLSAEDFGTGT